MFGLAFLLHGQHVMLPILPLPQQIQPCRTSRLGLLILADRPGLSPPPRCISGPPCYILARTHSHVSLFLAVNTFKISQCRRFHMAKGIKIAFCCMKPGCALKKHSRLLFAFCDSLTQKSVELVICTPTPL